MSRRLIQFDHHMHERSFADMALWELLMAYFKANPRAVLHTQADVINKIKEFSGREFSQGAVSSAFHTLDSFDLQLGNDVYRIRKDGTNYHMLLIRDDCDRLINKMIATGAFTKGHFAVLMPSAFVFSVKKDLLSSMVDSFKELLPEEIIFKIFTDEDTIIIILDTSVKGHQQYKSLLEHFFDERRLERPIR